ncbi:MAG: hypothetical protein Kow0069_34500 [Promethearchaeota archaeon]
MAGDKKGGNGEARSKRMVDLLNAARGTPLGQFPVPPFTKWLNCKVLSAERGRVELELEVRPEMANPTGLLHGGVQCAAMDDAIGIASATLGAGGFLLSLTLHVDYLGRVEVGQRVRVVGQITREGRRVVHARAEIVDVEGNLVASASSNLLRTTRAPEYAGRLDEFEAHSR